MIFLNNKGKKGPKKAIFDDFFYNGQNGQIRQNRSKSLIKKTFSFIFVWIPCFNVYTKK